MKSDDKKVNEILKKIDNVELIPDSLLNDMDFYELCYYMQTLNNVESLANVDNRGEE